LADAIVEDLLQALARPVVAHHDGRHFDGRPSLSGALPRLECSGMVTCCLT
jgi:hypothetical protein